MSFFFFTFLQVFLVVLLFETIHMVLMVLANRCGSWVSINGNFCPATWRLSLLEMPSSDLRDIRCTTIQLWIWIKASQLNLIICRLLICRYFPSLITPSPKLSLRTGEPHTISTTLWKPFAGKTFDNSLN